MLGSFVVRELQRRGKQVRVLARETAAEAARRAGVEVAIGDQRTAIRPDTCLGNLDWGRGVWEYRSFWVWASASGFLPDRRTIGLNLGFGFGDTPAASENTLILAGRVHKLAEVDFSYDSTDFKHPWRTRAPALRSCARAGAVAPDGLLDLEFIPFAERVARTNLGVITSEVHQLFGRYRGAARADDGELIQIDDLVDFAEEHHAKW